MRLAEAGELRLLAELEARGLAQRIEHDAARLDDNDPDLFFNLGYAFFMDRDMPAAVYWLREALRRRRYRGVSSAKPTRGRSPAWVKVNRVSTIRVANCARRFSARGRATDAGLRRSSPRLGSLKI